MLHPWQNCLEGRFGDLSDCRLPDTLRGCVVKFGGLLAPAPDCKILQVPLAIVAIAIMSIE